MGDNRSRIEKLKAMANQTASPNEAAVARRILEQMGEKWEDPKKADPYQNINYSDKKGTYESDEIFRKRRSGAYDYERKTGDSFGRSGFTEEFWREYVKNFGQRRDFYGQATGPRPGAGYERGPSEQAAYEETTRRRYYQYTDQALYTKQKAVYDRLLALFRDFRDDMDADEYGQWEQLLQRLDPNGIYFQEKVLKRQQQKANDQTFKYEYTFTSEERARRTYESTKEEMKKRDDERRKQEAADKAAQKIRDERERRERDEAMGSFERWFSEFKKGKG